MRVTFDSNVWRFIASPSVFPKEASLVAFLTIRAAVEKGVLSAFLSETVFTLEAIQRKDRVAFFGGYRGKIKRSVQVEPDGSVRVGSVLGPDPAIHAKNTPHLAKHLADALALGFKVMRIPRIGGFNNSDLPTSCIAEDVVVSMGQRQDRCGKCGHQIEAKGCGIAPIKTIGQRYANGKPWPTGLKLAPPSEECLITRAVAEWADGDAVAAHYGYGNDYFCTRDAGKSAGGDSVFAPGHRAWLERDFGVSFITPEDLAAKL